MPFQELLNFVLQSPDTRQDFVATTACFLILVFLTVCVVKNLKRGNLLSKWA